ncbi:MAG TPA: aminotransferase class V-fold PLP-dependent enzyme [Fimbriimonadaceae bacterium]|nr:aminotransferase class V-fold PLP-dependent enzyme [Fimbriimonadaceae bacterium]
MILLTPGPCMTSETVRQAAAMPDMNHRDPAFIEMLRETKERLLGVYPGLCEPPTSSPIPQFPPVASTAAGPAPRNRGMGFRPYLIGGSGTAAVEAMITSCVKTGPVLVVDSGYYSGRMRAKLDAHEIPYDVLSIHRLGDRLTREVAQKALAKKQYEAIVTTHHETSTGRLHDLAALGEICDQENVKLLVDGMSSFGADDIDFTHVEALACSANKCLHGLPGLSFVLVRDRLAEEMPFYPPRTVYLSLPFYEGDSPPLTPPVPILTALRQALIEMGEGGAKARGDEYRRRAGLLREGLRKRGFAFAMPENEMSCTLTMASIPEGWAAEEWFRANLDGGFMIYGTKGDLKERWFQVANMGELTDDHLYRWLDLVDRLTSR